MKNIFYSILTGVAFSFAMSESASAIIKPNNFTPMEKQVFCAGEACGTMKINTYKPVEDPRGTGALVGGVKIDGFFLPSKPVEFHYIQAITVDDVPLPYTDRTALPIPYIDTPPGGYLGQPFDFFPYYDEGEFPRFFDQPINPLTHAIGIGGDGKVNVKFETWLVCTIEEILGPDPMKAQDDKYEVAPLLGWTWGYNIEYTDDGNSVIDFNDFMTSADPFNWLMGTPSDDWKKAASKDTKYGNQQDFWDINSMGDCQDCEVPTDKDFGDAPDSYKTLLASDGPRYLEGDLQRLGKNWDREKDGQPTLLANGDDLDRWDDEDGVIFGDSWVDVLFNIFRPGENKYQLRAWWDTNYNGMFDHTSELYIDDLLTLDPLADGRFKKRYNLGFNPKADGLYSRFRLTWDPLDLDVKPFGEYYSKADCNTTDAAAGNCISHGEVEDYVHVPEPSSIFGLLAFGGLGLMGLRKKR